MPQNDSVKYKRLKMSRPIPVMLDADLLAKVEAMSAKIGEAKSTVMRIAMRFGLEDMEKMYQARPDRQPEKTGHRTSYPSQSQETSRIEEKPVASPPPTKTKAA